MKHSSVLLLPALLALGCAHPAPAPPPTTSLAPGILHSPWDSTPVKPNPQLAYECGPALVIGPDITVTAAIDSRNKNLSEDVKAAVYAESSSALQDLSKRVVSAADVYRTTGSLSAANCAGMLLTDAASHMAITGYMASTQAWNEHNYALRAFSIAFLKVRGAGVIQPQYTQVITTWLDGLARMERSYVEHLRCDAHKCGLHSHSGNQIAMAAATCAIAANDPSLFHWAISQYKAAVGMIDDRGMLHYDNRSGRWAHIWNLESAAALVQIAELAEVNNDPLYGYDNGRIHLLVHTAALGLVDPTAYKAATGAAQKVRTPIQPWEVVWASVYNRRFHDPVLEALLRQIGLVPVDMWGGEPWSPEDDPS